ncbi:hemagglutinin repeat-containing protein [Aeromonas hydrophila]
MALRAGSDLAMRAAHVQAEGELAVTAGRDLLLEAGDAMDYRESYTKESKKKALSKKTTTSHDISEQHMAQATELGGQYLLLKAQQDMAVKGSNVVGDLGATLLAGRDLNIDTVDLLNRELHFRETKRSGLMGSGGIGFTIGKQQQSSDMAGTTQIREGSSVGSVQGDVTLQAGNRLQISASDVIAGKDLLLVGKDVAITSAEQQITRKEEFKSKSGGLTVALTGGAVTALQSAYDTVKTSKESSNDRLVALQGAKAAMNGYQAWQGMQAMANSGGVPDPSFVGIAISVGNQRSQSTSQSSETNALTSELNAGGDITVLAKGDEANGSGDLIVSGSSIKGQNVTLGAARDLVLQSAVNSSDSSGSNHSSGWNAGVSFGFSQGSAGISIFANMNAAKGKENGDSDRYTETNITAGDILTLKSGRDATLLGAQVSGDKVTADIGRNLTLTSQQDNDHYQSQQSSISAGGSFTFGTMTASGYVNASRQKINSDFESVVEQTGVFAGKQGFDIRVGEHTQLNGAVLAGSEDAGKNHLSTGTLGWNDLVNRAEYKVESQSVGISGSGDSTKGFSSIAAMTSLGGSNSSGSASSTTFASIGAGDIEIRNTAGQQQDLVSLHRDPTLAVNGLSPIFDKQKELERMQEAQLIGEVGQQATQMVVSHHLAAANEKAKNDPEYANSKAYKELQEKWGVGSDFQRGMQAATAALQGLAGGDLTQAAAGAAAPYLAQMVKQQTDDGISRVMAHALVQGALATAQNKNAMVSATGAATGELAGMMATELYHKDASQLTEGEKETVSTLATLAAGLAGGLTGDSTASALGSAQTGKTVVENNLLAKALVEGCAIASPCRTKVAEQIIEISIKAGIVGLAGVAIKNVADKMSSDELDHLITLSMMGNDEITEKYIISLQDKYGLHTGGNQLDGEFKLPQHTGRDPKVDSTLVLTHTGNDKPNADSITNTGNTDSKPDVGSSTTVTPLSEATSKDDLLYLSERVDNRLPIPEPIIASNGFKVESNTKHTPGAPGFRPNAGIEPKNSMDLFEHSIATKDPKVRLSIDNDGNIHRFFNTSKDGTGTYHWSGSSGDGKNALGNRELGSFNKEIKELKGKK